ncbi:MAG: flagellar basal body rod protein FlgC [Clostridiaceae bacterium]|nr:flagellar basal body rod protein FlgC [Clostridiaceae bacterium]HPU45391.1 flagellar basal body rod protein FlgC [Thermoclostridium sp.]
MSFFRSFNISSSALTAQRLRMDVIAQNIANVNTTRTEDGTPYRRKTLVFQERESAPFSQYLSRASRERFLSGSGAGGGVRVTAIVEDPSPFREVYDPGHPDADENGIVQMPNVDIITEMVNMISATRAYEANVTALDASKAMASKALEIGR